MRVRLGSLKKIGIAAEGIAVFILLCILISPGSDTSRSAVSDEAQKDYIKWVDFDVTAEAMETAYECDLDAHENGVDIRFVELLAYTAAKNGGKFGSRDLAVIEDLYDIIRSGEATIDELTRDLNYYSYYLEAYSAVLGGFVGEYEIETAGEGGEGDTVWEKRYGLKVFSPIAKGFEYSDYDDFGAARSYGYQRQHLGHDMTGQIGTPIICVESGYVEALGWNQYGGWRIGIRSFDQKRYYYYAHLRQNYPYAEGLEEGSIVTAGDVIGYLGHTGYSTTENVNNIDIPHLHFGIQLIFDESQKEGNNEIWIDCYQITRFLSRNRSLTEKIQGTKEWKRVYDMKEPGAKAKETG